MPESFAQAFRSGDPDAITALDEAAFWSAPFGLSLLKTVKLVPGMRILDIGCGAGFPLLELASRLNAKGLVTGLDPWSAGLERTARKALLRGTSNIRLVEGVAEFMPFEDASFDAIVSNNGLNNVSDVVTALQECARVARPRAQLVMTANLPRTFSLFYDLFESLLEERNLVEHISALRSHIQDKRKTLETWSGLVEKAGFRIRAICEESFTWSFLDGTAFLNHWAIQLAFRDPWVEFLPAEQADSFMTFMEGRLNRLALERGGLHLEVPFFCLDALRV